MDFELHPIEIDRALRRAHRAWLSWKLRERALEDEGDEHHPLAAYRSVTGLSAFRAISDLPQGDPLRAPLRRWVYRLAEQRINHPTSSAITRERLTEHHHPDMPARQAVSFAEMLKGALGDTPRRDPWTRLSIEHARPISALSVELWQRRGEVARRLGLAHPGAIEAPMDGVAALADSLTLTTRDRVRELGLRSLSDYFERAIGADVPGQWPARLSSQRLYDFFREGSLLRSLDVATGPLPRSFGAASFIRALGMLGAGWFEALAPRDQPFVVAHDPYGLGRHESASLFSALPLNPRFARLHLDVSPQGLPDMQRRLAQIWLLDLASLAFRVRLRGPALAGERSFREAFAELSSADLTVSLPETAAGALFSLGIEDEQALVGRLLAVSRTEALIEAHDEDWFRNPRAIEQLRAEASLPPSTTVEPERVELALKQTTQRLQAFLR